MQITMNKYIAILLLAFTESAFADYLDCPCKVVKVSDGDTVHVLDQSTVEHKIRLGGIDAPEKKQAFGISMLGTGLCYFYFCPACGGHSLGFTRSRLADDFGEG